MSRSYAWTLSIGIVALVFLPIAENSRWRPRDSFPLSYYPMFSSARPEVLEVTYVVGIDADGNRSLIHHRYVGSGGLNQIRKQLKRTVKQGPENSQALCQSIARNVARRDRMRELCEVRIVTGKYRPADRFLLGIAQPLEETIHASCAVERDER
jgi:hypothetical protein